MAAENNHIHPNNLRASQLIFGTMILGIICELFMNSGATSAPSLQMIFSFVFLGGIAVLVRKGYRWVKYVLLVMTILGVLITPFVFSLISRSPMHVLMFKANDQNAKSGSDDFIVLVDKHWTQGADGPSPEFPCLDYWLVNHVPKNFDVFDAFTLGVKPEFQDIGHLPSPGERSLDQQGRIFRYVMHPAGFYYPKITDEKPTEKMLMDALDFLGEKEFRLFLSMEKLGPYVVKHCSHPPVAP